MRRTLVYVMGRDGSDNSALISALINSDNSDDKTTTTTTASSLPFTGNDRVPSPTASSSTVSSFSSTSSSSSPSSSTEPGVVIHEWSPFHPNTDRTDAESGEKEKLRETTTIQLWELPGSKLQRDAHTVYMRSHCLVVVVLDMHGDESQSTDLREMLNRLESRCPGSHIVIALSQPSTDTNNHVSDNKEVSRRVDQIQNTVNDWTSHVTQNVKREILDIECDLQIAAAKEITNQNEGEKESNPSLKDLAHKYTDYLHTKLQQGLHIDDTIYTVSTSDGQEVQDLRRAVIEKATNKDLFPHLAGDDEDWVAATIDTVQDMENSGHVMVPLKEFNESVVERCQDKEMSKEKIMQACQQLEASGYILLVTPHSMSRNAESNDGTVDSSSYPIGSTHRVQDFVCVNPGALANMVLNCLIEDDKKTYKLEANRFWPRDSGFKPPDAELLARVLEALPQEGCIREAILPILWQDYAYDETQIFHTFKCLESLGVLVSYDKSCQDCAGLAMPHYPRLSAKNTHVSVLMDKIPKKRPQLNWTSKPFKDDIQIAWKMTSLTSLCPSTTRRSLAHIRTCMEPLCDYIHIWDEGVLIKFAEATICVEMTKTAITISCRVNADDGELKEKTVQGLWLHLATVVKVEMDFLSWQIPGAVFQTKLLLYGSVFFYNKVTQNELEVSLVKCLATWRFGGHVTVFEGMVEHHVNLKVLFPYGDESIWTPSHWLKMVLIKSKELNVPLSKTLSKESRHTSKKKRHFLHKKSSKRNRGVEVKWKTNVEDGETEKENLPDTAITNASSTNTATTTTTTTTAPDNNSTPAFTDLTKVSTMTREDWTKKASELAGQFVSCTLALAVADFVALKCQSLQGQHTEAQCTSDIARSPGPTAITRYIRGLAVSEVGLLVSAARRTANAALAVYTGDLDEAARAVVEAVHAADKTGKQGKASNTKSSDNSSSHQSRLCTIL